MAVKNRCIFSNIYYVFGVCWPLSFYHPKIQDKPTIRITTQYAHYALCVYTTQYIVIYAIYMNLFGMYCIGIGAHELWGRQRIQYKRIRFKHIPSFGEQ